MNGQIRQVNLKSGKCPTCGRRIGKPGGAVYVELGKAIFLLGVCSRCVRQQRFGTDAQRVRMDKNLRAWCEAQYAAVQNPN